MPRDDEFHCLDAQAPKHVTLTAEQQQRRIMLIGDVHGCCDELRQLIRKYGDRENDLIIFLGDLVNKGPKSVEVVRFARELNALAVVGNHELAALKGRQLREVDRANAPAFAWTDDLSSEDICYLSTLPYTITIPRHNAIAVHAGLVPELPLEQQKPRDMVSMRNVKRQPDKGNCWEAFELETEGNAWASEWQGPAHVYFGHDAKRKLQTHAFATGLDTGCLYGGELTAVFLSPDGTKKLESVPSYTAYQKGPKQTTLATTIPRSPKVLFSQRRILLPVSMCVVFAAACWFTWKRSRQSQIRP